MTFTTPRPFALALKRIGVLVIGDEILAGHVHESNSHWVAQQVKPLGIALRRVEVCTDELPDIEASVRRFVFDLGLDYVITSGGLGPTPDDRTMEGIARAVGRPLVARPEHVEWMRQRTKVGHRLGYFREEEPNAGLLKMTLLPEGAEAMPNDIGTALGAIVKAGPTPTTLFTLPGVPAEFYRMFNESILPRLEPGPAIHTEELVLHTEESRLFEVLRDLEREFPEVTLGSYPERGQIRIRATSTDPSRSKALMDRMRESAKDYLEPSAAWQARMRHSRGP